MIQGQAFTDVGVASPPDPWSGWARLADIPAPVEHEIDDEPEPAPESASSNDSFVRAVARLAAELADERRLRAAAEEARRAADDALQRAHADIGTVNAELAGAKARIAELERDRDEVIRRAEELLSAVRERGDQRLAAELDGARGHWSELLAEEHRRVEVLEAERASLAQRAEDAWLAAAVLRRSRPLRPRSSTPTTHEAAEGEVLEDLEKHETDPVLAADSPHLVEEIELLRQRLRARLHKPPEMDEVEEGVDQLREARLAREAPPRGRRRK